MFSDELRIRCHKCGKFVYKENRPSCIDWCSAAKDCLGAERWESLRDARAVGAEVEEKND
jgi:hypothetical protein